jgi:hypothetical protein
MDFYYFSKATFKFLKVIKNPDVSWKLSKVMPTVFFHPHMTWNEYLLFKKICRNAYTFIEYGSGGSTIYLLKHDKKVFSVESNPEFYQYMNSIRLLKQAAGKNLHFQFIDLGPTNKWGRPLTSEKSESWSAYYKKIWEKIDPYRDKIDVIFIDGRFRVSCCLYSILKVLAYNWRETVFVIHDFWRRNKYHVVLKFLDVEKSETNLVSFKLKPNINIREVKEMLEEYNLIPA